jgi:hypothetical protein
MDERSLSDMAARVAGSPPTDHLGEIVELVTACRRDIGEIAEGWVQGRLTEEAYRSMSSRLAVRSRTAADILRLSHEEMMSVIPRAATRNVERAQEPAGDPESTG